MIERPENHAGIGDACLGFTDQAQALPEPDQSEKRFSLNRQLIYGRMSSKVRKAANNIVLDLGTWVQSADDKALVLKLLPENRWRARERVAFRHGHSHPFAPHFFKFAPRG